MGDERGTITKLPSANRSEALRIIEARLFAAVEPVRQQSLAELLPDNSDLTALLEELRGLYAGRGVNLVAVGDAWMFRTADDLAYVMQRYAREERRLSKAALETLAIIAYHQPVTRAEIEEVRGVATSKGTLDALMELGWVRPRGRRRAPGRPVTYGTTAAFLAHFSLESLSDLPGMAELKGAGLLSANLPPDFEVPEPRAVADLMPDELPLEDEPPDDPVVADLFEDDDDERDERDADAPGLPGASGASGETGDGTPSSKSDG
ncbi:MAG: SMC-Scp complex subunit ScpB [Pseudomonadota bacterium]